MTNLYSAARAPAAELKCLGINVLSVVDISFGEFLGWQTETL